MNDCCQTTHTHTHTHTYIYPQGSCHGQIDMPLKSIIVRCLRSFIMNCSKKQNT